MTCPECGRHWTGPLQVAKEPSPRALDGLRLIARSPYLQLITLFMLLMAILTTFLTMEQNRLIFLLESTTGKRAERFASVDLWTNIVTLVTQVFLTARFIRWIGLGGTLCLLPALSIAGFAAVAAWPLIGIIAGFQALRRGLGYALTRPAREVLFTVLGPDEKYKSKSFIDTFVYRAGDGAGVWAFAGLQKVAMSASLIAVPLSVVWLVSAVGLGWMQRRQAAPSSAALRPTS